MSRAISHTEHWGQVCSEPVSAMPAATTLLAVCGDSYQLARGRGLLAPGTSMCLASFSTMSVFSACVLTFWVLGTKPFSKTMKGWCLLVLSHPMCSSEDAEPPRNRRRIRNHVQQWPQWEEIIKQYLPWKQIYIHNFKWLQYPCWNELQSSCICLRSKVICHPYSGET